ncbi:glutathione S-transferase family protein [Flexibacterium corallicola]|uniref:glutathione S-transferase family protein n=1 Tax=Flexibacterium corallicola TaxID=3037259 RepID=UPI00286F8F8D|nr:glutathione S-transferase family protein [Pseudovibrio sp. M1P-2-3]
MKLYGVVGSPNTRKVCAVINHLGLSVDVNWVDFLAGDLKKRSFAALNPNEMVPVLEDGDFVLWESNAINTYLCEKAGDTKLYPTALRERALVNQWLSWEVAHYNNHLGVAAFEAAAKPRLNLGETDRHLVEVSLRKLARFAQVLETHLQGREFMVGNDWTLADYAVGHVEMFMEAVPFDWSAYPNIVSFYKRFRANSNWEKTAPASLEGLGRAPETATAS